MRELSIVGSLICLNYYGGLVLLTIRASSRSMEHCGVTIQRLEGDVSDFLNSSTCLRSLARSWEDVVDDDDGGYADGEDDSSLQAQPP